MIPYEGWDREYQQNKDEYLKLFDNFMSQGNYENCEQFEKEFAELIGRKYAVSVANATDALHFSLRSRNIGPGDEVLVTDFSWISTSSCISMVGATPVFCDIDADTCHISLESIKRMTTPNTKALVYTHLFGNMSDTTDIEQYCKDNGIMFVEDAAQSLGSRINNRKAGSIGDCSSFSFNTNKVISGVNGGGMFLTDNEQLANTVKKLRRHGKGKDYEMLGYNSRMYVLNAQIIQLRLKNLTRDRQIREQNAMTYNSAFKDLPIQTPTVPFNVVHNWHKYTIIFKDKDTRNKVKNKLNLSVHYETPLSENSMYSAWSIDYKKDDCVNSKQVADTILSLPVHAYLEQHEIATLIKSIKESLQDASA